MCLLLDNKLGAKVNSYEFSRCSIFRTFFITYSVSNGWTCYKTQLSPSVPTYCFRGSANIIRLRGGKQSTRNFHRA